MYVLPKNKNIESSALCALTPAADHRPGKNMLPGNNPIKERPGREAFKYCIALQAAKMPFPDRAGNQRINTLPGQPKPLNSQIDAIQRKMYLTALYIVLWYIQSHR